MSEEVFPHWFFGPGWHSLPDGAEMICDTAADVPEGWVRSPSLLIVQPTSEPAPEPANALDHDGDGNPGGSTAPESTDRLKELRAEYQALVGKRPFPGWDEAELERRMAEHKPAEQEIDTTEF